MLNREFAANSREKQALGASPEHSCRQKVTEIGGKLELPEQDLLFNITGTLIDTIRVLVRFKQAI